jgi:tetratricopeptide (TPR) repeat protein
LNNLGNAAMYQQAYTQATDYYNASLVLRHELGDQVGIANALHNLGTLAQEQGDDQQAWVFYEQSLQIKRAVGNQVDLSSTLCGMISIARRQGKLTCALSYFCEGFHIASELGCQMTMYEYLVELALILTAQGHVAQATQLAHAVEHVGRVYTPLLMPAARTEWETTQQTLRLQIADAEWHAAWVAAQAMSQEHVKTLALELYALASDGVDVHSDNVSAYTLHFNGQN